jgi:GTPase SAR1 family protein
MAISLSSLRKLKADKPARILIYGEPKIGKTTLASEFPGNIFLQLEDGTPKGIDAAGWGRDEIKTFGDVLDAMAVLAVDKHDYHTVTTDSASELEKLVLAETCARHGKSSIEDWDYGKGYVHATEVWQEYIEAINTLRTTRDMTTILIAHCVTSRFDNPETTSYSKYAAAIHSSDKPTTNHRGMIEAEMDAIILLKNDVAVKTEKQGMNKERSIAQGGSNVFIHAAGKASYIAGNRFGIPPKLKYERGHGFEALAPYLPALPARATDKAA